MEMGKHCSISAIALCLFFSSPCFSQEMDLDRIYYDFYAGNMEAVRSTATSVIAGAENGDLLHYINSCKVISVLYSTGQLPDYENRIKMFDDAIIKKLRNAQLTSVICLSYADYLYSKLSWESDNTQTVMALPVWYRRALFLNPDNTEANIKLALWYISAADENTGMWNSFIRQQEKSIDLLGEVDRFNACLLYSMFYMKIYNVNKGLLYLERARNLFPDNPLPALIAYNYKEGKLSW